MNSEKLIAILTPAYNRARLLKRLYQSLLSQNSYNFVWYIIDDGSNDSTKKIVDGFNTDKFNINYYYKNNGGKHTALNYGVNKINEELVFIVDSDDYLTEGAISSIENNWPKYSNNNSICGLSYYRLNSELKIIGSEYPESITISTYAEMRVNKKIYGDKAEIWRTSILKKYPFPEYEGERFLSEAIVWNAISAFGYKLVFISEGIYICDYLEGGLTKSGRKLRLETPFGTLHHARSFFYEKINYRNRIKYLLYYDAISIYSKKISYAYNKCDGIYRLGYILAFIPSTLIVLYWRKKYQ